MIAFSRPLLVAAGLALLPAAAFAADPATATLTLTADGVVSAAPDTAIVSLGVVQEADTADKALTANNAAMQKTLSALKEAGVATTEDLLEKAGSAAGRKQLAAELGTQASEILTWVNEADLMRISGIAEGFSQLLEAAGVDTVKELAQRNAENLTAKIAEVNEQMKLTGRVPNQETVEGWITQAKSLVPKVTH